MKLFISGMALIAWTAITLVVLWALHKVPIYRDFSVSLKLTLPNPLIFRVPS